MLLNTNIKSAFNTIPRTLLLKICQKLFKYPKDLIILEDYVPHVNFISEKVVLLVRLGTTQFWRLYCEHFWSTRLHQLHYRVRASGLGGKLLTRPQDSESFI